MTTGETLAELYALALDPAVAWMDWAICPEIGDPDLFFAGKGDPVSSKVAKALCEGCPVISECLAYAREHNLAGVWGGTTETERKRMRPCWAA